MASSSGDAPVMGYPPAKQNQNPPPPPGYPVPAMPIQPGAYPPLPPAGFNGGYTGPTRADPSFNGWYNSRNYGQMSWAGADEINGKNFERVMLVTMFTLIVCMCMVSFAIFTLFGMDIPECHVINLSVSNLTATDSLIAGSWDANITVYNPNTDINMTIEPSRASLFYKNSPLGISSLETFNLQGIQMHNVEISLDNEKSVSTPILSDQMRVDKKNGLLYISLRINLGTKFAGSSTWRKENFKVFCEDLKVTLAPGGGSGSLAVDARTKCLVLN